jgi:hypothetical protein
MRRREGPGSWRLSHAPRTLADNSNTVKALSLLEAAVDLANRRNSHSASQERCHAKPPDELNGLLDSYRLLSGASVSASSHGLSGPSPTGRFSTSWVSLFCQHLESSASKPIPGSWCLYMLKRISAGRSISSAPPYFDRTLQMWRQVLGS